MFLLFGGWGWGMGGGLGVFWTFLTYLWWVQNASTVQDRDEGFDQSQLGHGLHALAQHLIDAVACWLAQQRLGQEAQQDRDIAIVGHQCDVNPWHKLPHHIQTQTGHLRLAGLIRRLQEHKRHTGWLPCLQTSVPRVLIRLCTDSNQAYLSGSVLTATKCIHTCQALYWQQPSVLIRLCTDSNQVYLPGSVLTAIKRSVLTNIIVIKCIQQHLYQYWCHSKQVHSPYLFYVTLHICTNADVMAVKHTHQYLQPRVSQLSHTAFSHAVLNGRVPHRLLKTASVTRTHFKDGFYDIWHLLLLLFFVWIFFKALWLEILYSLLAVIWSYTFVRA